MTPAQMEAEIFKLRALMDMVLKRLAVHDKDRAARIRQQGPIDDVISFLPDGREIDYQNDD